MIKKVINKYQQNGLIGLIGSVSNHFRPRKTKHIQFIKNLISTGRGIEVGGFSPVFTEKGVIPIYESIESLDNCNFSSNTVWEGTIDEGHTFQYSKVHRPGKQYVLEATSMKGIENDSYDFLLSSHVIEHTANPIKAMKEWTRIVKTNGYLILLIPHKDGTFDHARPVTSLEHLIADYKNDTTEKDLTHLDEILKLHDLSMDPEAGDYQQFTERSKQNFDNRCLHHHVFNSRLVVELIDYLQLSIKAIEAIAPMHILVIAQKPTTGDIPDNSKYFELVNSKKYESPFSSDRV